MTLHHGRGRVHLACQSLLVLVLLGFWLVIVANSIFVYPRFVHWVEPGEEKSADFGLRRQFLWLNIRDVSTLPSLVEVNEEDDIVSEAGQPVGRRHGDDKGENVIDEGVEGLTANDAQGE